MNATTEEALRRYSRGELTSRSLRDQTGLDYSEVLDAMGRMGLRLPRPNYEGPNGAALKRGRDLLLSALMDHKG